MKLNWGTGLLLTIILSSLGIVFLVVLSTREKIDLVTEEYYPRELEYEQQIEKLKNTQLLGEKIAIQRFSDSIVFQFPRVSEHVDNFEGEIWFYFPSDKFGDKRERIHLNPSFKQVFLLTGFKKGKYEIIVDWKVDGKEYLQKELFLVMH